MKLLPLLLSFSSLFCAHATVFNSSHLSTEGAKVPYSSSTNLPSGSITVEVLDLSSPQLLENGQYSEIIVQRVTERVGKYLELNGVRKYQFSPASESFFAHAFEYVLMEIYVDTNVLIPPVFEALISEVNTRKLLKSTFKMIGLSIRDRLNSLRAWKRPCLLLLSFKKLT